VTAHELDQLGMEARVFESVDAMRPRGQASVVVTNTAFMIGARFLREGDAMNIASPDNNYSRGRPNWARTCRDDPLPLEGDCPPNSRACPGSPHGASGAAVPSPKWSRPTRLARRWEGCSDSIGQSQLSTSPRSRWPVRSELVCTFAGEPLDQHLKHACDHR
jgi:hypothetical protein